MYIYKYMCGFFQAFVDGGLNAVWISDMPGMAPNELPDDSQ